MDTVRELRNEVVPQVFGDVPVEVLVGGDTAYNVDYLDQTTFYTPIVFLFVLGLSFVLLTVAFRSLVIPAKAIAMNLLSVGAAFGLVVLFFQRGRRARVLQGHRRLARLRPGRGDRGRDAAVPVRHPVRALDGLPRLPALQDP